MSYTGHSMLTLYVVVLFADCHKPPSVRPQLHESVHLRLHVGQVSSQPSARMSSLLLLLLKLAVMRMRMMMTTTTTTILHFLYDALVYDRIER